ncbi:hypothetical protein GOBAR_DD35854 [Gossypium barbadense]|nr:hypothetical protein GOBAR_DD35854 [Gossypium barbadense]
MDIKCVVAKIQKDRNTPLVPKIYQVGLRSDKIDVVIKVQHPGIQDLMITDICNLQAFALYIQKNDIKNRHMYSH